MKDKQTDKIINWISRNIILIYLGFIAILFVMPFVFIIQSPFGLIESKKANEIGDAINGLTAPIIGSFSALLVYLAFKTQVDFNKNQLLSNELNQIKIDLEQTINDLNKLSYIFYERDSKRDKIKRQFEYHGIEAINVFSTNYKLCIDNNINTFFDYNFLEGNFQQFLNRGKFAFECLSLILLRIKALDNHSINFKKYQVARLTSILLHEIKELKETDCKFGICQNEIKNYVTARNKAIMHLIELQKNVAYAIHQRTYRQLS